jgi:hypothetical protein
MLLKHINNPGVLRVVHVNDPPTRCIELHVVDLQMHENLDIAIDRVRLPQSISLQHLSLGIDELSPGEQIFIYGLSNAIPTDLEPEHEGRLPELHLSLDLMFYVDLLATAFRCSPRKRWKHPRKNWLPSGCSPERRCA